MPERLHLARTFGVPGWQEWRFDAGAPVLAALAHCLRHPATSFTLRGLWRGVALWRERFASIAPSELRLALSLPRTIALADVTVRIAVTPPKRGRPAAQEFSLDLRRHPARADDLPDAPAGSAWHVLRLADGADAVFIDLVSALGAAPTGSRLAVDVLAHTRCTDAAADAVLPLRAECRLRRGEDWFPLLRSLRLDTARPRAEAE